MKRRLLVFSVDAMVFEDLAYLKTRPKEGSKPASAKACCIFSVIISKIFCIFSIWLSIRFIVINF